MEQCKHGRNKKNAVTDLPYYLSAKHITAQGSPFLQIFIGKLKKLRLHDCPSSDETSAQFNTGCNQPQQVSLSSTNTTAQVSLVAINQSKYHCLRKKLLQSIKVSQVAIAHRTDYTGYFNRISPHSHVIVLNIPKSL
jgi:hypothetical protein